MKKGLGLLIGSLLLVGCGLKKPLVIINGVKVAVEVRDTSAERQQGLSGRERLGEDEGMLFVFEQPGIYPFWMKDMKFPLDFVWMRENKVVDLREKVGITEMNIKPGQPADKVLEVNSGWIEKHKIKVGDEVK